MLKVRKEEKDPAVWNRIMLSACIRCAERRRRRGKADDVRGPTKVGLVCTCGHAWDPVCCPQGMAYGLRLVHACCPQSASHGRVPASASTSMASTTSTSLGLRGAEFAEAWPVKARVSGNVSVCAAPAPKAIQNQTANDSHPCSKHGSSGCSGTVVWIPTRR